MASKHENYVLNEEIVSYVCSKSSVYTDVHLYVLLTTGNM